MGSTVVLSMQHAVAVCLFLLSSLPGMAQELAQDANVSPAPRLENPLTLSERLTLFTNKTLTGGQPYAATLVSSAVLDFLGPARVWGRGADDYTNHILASFTRRLVTYGLQSGAAAALHEDLRYKPSSSGNVWKRSGHALLSTLILETPRGNQVAFANIVAAAGSGVVINYSHPGRGDFDHPGTVTLTGENLLGFAEGNLWNEFKPDVRHFLRRSLFLRRRLRLRPDSSP